MTCAMNADVAETALRGQLSSSRSHRNTDDMQVTGSTAINVTVLDIDPAVASDDPYEVQKTESAAAKGLVEAHRWRYRRAGEVSRSAL